VKLVLRGIEAVKSAKGNRIWELDFLRGIALILMIYFHVLYDMKEIFGYPVTYESGINFYAGKLSGILFIFISGISCSLSRSNIKRGIRVLVIALAITLVTHLYNPAFGIKFGILHFLGVSMLLFPVIRRVNPIIQLAAGTLIIASRHLLSGISVGYDYLFPFGIHSSSFISSDYYPMIPWFGLFLYGSAVGILLYEYGRSPFNISFRENIINKIGKNTLLVYILHQPAIILVLYCLSLLR